MLTTNKRSHCRGFRGLVLLLLLNLAAFAAVADDDGEWEQPLEELFLSDLVFPQERGEVQVTLSASRADRQEGERLQLPLTLEYGITDRLQVELEWGGYRRDRFDADDRSSDDFGDAEIGVSYSWMAVGDSPWHIATGLEVPVDLGNTPMDDDESDEGEEEDEGIEPFFVLARDLGRWSGSQISLGGGAEVGEGETEWFGSLAGFVPVRGWVATAEINWTEEESYFTPGVVWHPGGEWELGVGLPIGLGREADDWRWIATLTYEFEPRD